MSKLRNGSQVTTRPTRKATAGTAGYFSESNDNGEPSYPGQDWFNDVIDEIIQAVTAAGVTYDPTKITNLKTTVEALRNASNLNAGTVNIARLPVTEDATDSTPNKLLKTLDFGVGRTDALTYPYTDSANSEGSGFYRDGDFAVIISRRDPSTGLEVSGRFDSDRFYLRRMRVVDGGWQDRVEIFHDGKVASSSQINSGTQSDTVITPAGLSGSEYGLGVNQTWQDVTSSRSSNVTYTNSTGKPIQVLIYKAGAGLDGFVVDGVNVAGESGQNDKSVQCIIPNGSTYKLVTVSTGFSFWSELR